MTQLELILAGGLSQAASRASLGWSIGAISDYLALLYPDASRTAIAQVAYIANASVQAAREARGPEGVEGITPSDVPIRPGLEAGEWQTTVSVTIISPRTSRSERFVIRVRSEERRVGKECRCRWARYH